MGITNEITEKVLADELTGWVRDAARRLTDLVADLDNEQLIGPRLAITNPRHGERGGAPGWEQRLRLPAADGQPLGMDCLALKLTADRQFSALEVDVVHVRPSTVDSLGQYLCRVRLSYTRSIVEAVDRRGPRRAGSHPRLSVYQRVQLRRHQV